MIGHLRCIALAGMFWATLCAGKGPEDPCAALRELTQHIQLPEPLAYEGRISMDGEPPSGLSEMNLELPPEFRHMARELAAAHRADVAGKKAGIQSPPRLTQENHRVFAEKIVAYLASRGIKATATEKENGPGYFIRFEKPNDGFAKAIKQANHLLGLFRDIEPSVPDVNLGFDTGRLLKNIAGLPGSAYANAGKLTVALSLKELLGDRIYSAGRHEIGHLRRGLSQKSVPQFRFLNPSYAQGAISSTVYSSFLLEEVSETYPESMEDEASQAMERLKEARALHDFPALKQALEAEALRSAQRMLFEGRVMAEMFQASETAFRNLEKAKDGTGVQFTKTNGSRFDRKMTLPTGEVIAYRSQQVDEWVCRAYGYPRGTHHDAWSMNMTVRYALLAEHHAMREKIEIALDTVRQILSVPEFASLRRP